MLAATQNTFTSLVEEHLTSLIEEAKCIQRHTKRVRCVRRSSSTSSSKRSGIIPPTTTSSSSIQNGSLPHSNLENDNGNDEEYVMRNLLDVEDINLALKMRGCESIYSPNVEELSSRKRTCEHVDLNSYIRSEMKSVPPSEIGLCLHWLAVDGIQPSIPQNPIARAQLSSSQDGRIVHKIEDDEDDVTMTTSGDATTLNTTSSNEDETSGNIRIRKLIPRLLSEELQIYFTRITLAIEEQQNQQQQDAALKCVSRDDGIQELVPFFSRFVSREIFRNVGKTEYCRLLIRFANAMVSNPHIHLELHLHQMMPAILTCIVASHLSTQTFDDHWALREEASMLLLKTCNMFGSQYPTLKSRVLKTLCEALDINTKPLSSVFGGISGIRQFGPKAIDAFLLPISIFYWKKWEVHLQTIGTDSYAYLELQHCQYALLSAIGIFLHYSSLFDKVNDINVEEFKDVFGEKLVPFYHDQFYEYNTLFI